MSKRSSHPTLVHLLPAFPLLFVLASAVFVRGLEWLPFGLRMAAVFLLCVLLPIWYVVKAGSMGVFYIQTRGNISGCRG